MVVEILSPRTWWRDLRVKLPLYEETGVREGLQASKETLSDLYVGNPKRETARPTTERLLRAFRDITLTVVYLEDRTIRHVTPLSQLQRRILALLGLPAAIYKDLASSVGLIPP